MLFADKLTDIIKTLETNGVLLHPTDTIWGLACSAHSSQGIEKIYSIKKRPRNKPFLLLVDSLERLKKYVPHIHPRIETLLVHHKKPLTVVYPNVVNLPKFALASDGSAAIRIIKDPFCNQILKLLGLPLVSTSANISSDPFPKHYSQVHREIITQVDYISKHRRDEEFTGNPSVMISYDEEGEISFLRT